jgi:hypothetical protein
MQFSSTFLDYIWIISFVCLKNIGKESITSFGISLISSKFHIIESSAVVKASASSYDEGFLISARKLKEFV